MPDDAASGFATRHVTVRVPNELVASFDRIAEVLERPRSWVLLRALKQYLDSEGADILGNAAGIAALDRGEGADLDEVVAELDSVIAEVEAGRSKGG